MFGARAANKVEDALLEIFLPRAGLTKSSLLAWRHEAVPRQGQSMTQCCRWYVHFRDAAPPRRPGPWGKVTDGYGTDVFEVSRRDGV
jgi:hypothetical protein